MDRRKIPTAMIVAFAVVGALALLAWLILRDERTTTDRGRTPIMTNQDPAARAAAFGMKEADTTGAAADRVGHVVLTGRGVPGLRLSSVWIGADGGSVLEVYESGLTVLTETSEIGPDPSTYYQAVVGEADRPTVFLTKIDGVVALAVEPGTDKLGTNPGLVRFGFASGGLSIVVSGAGMSVEELSSVAEQLAPVAAS